MENEKESVAEEQQKKHPHRNVFIFLTFLFAAMGTLGFLSYRYIRGVCTVPPKHAPTAPIASAAPTSAAPTATAAPVLSPLLPENNGVSPDNYLIIAEENGVMLYLITPSGAQVFLRATDIRPTALTEEDQATLQEGIIVNTEEELCALLEDYTS